MTTEIFFYPITRKVKQPTLLLVRKMSNEHNHELLKIEVVRQIINDV